MSERQSGVPAGNDRAARENRKFSVSTNRGKANHKIRYVEVGGGAVDTEECTFCESVPDLSGPTSDKTP